MESAAALILAQDDQTRQSITLLIVGLVMIAAALAFLSIWYWRYTDPRRRPTTTVGVWGASPTPQAALETGRLPVTQVEGGGVAGGDVTGGMPGAGSVGITRLPVGDDAYFGESSQPGFSDDPTLLPLGFSRFSATPPPASPAPVVKPASPAPATPLSPAPPVIPTVPTAPPLPPETHALDRAEPEHSPVVDADSWLDALAEFEEAGQPQVCDEVVCDEVVCDEAGTTTTGFDGFSNTEWNDLIASALRRASSEVGSPGEQPIWNEATTSSSDSGVAG